MTAPHIITAKEFDRLITRWEGLLADTPEGTAKWHRIMDKLARLEEHRAQEFGERDDGSNHGS